MKPSQYNTIHQNDQLLMDAFEQQMIQLAEFNHQLHIKLAYSYLAKYGLKTSTNKMSEGLRRLLKFKGVSAEKYHATITIAWLKAVWHFMQQGEHSSADQFIEAHPSLLNKNLLQAHYSSAFLFSSQARKKYLGPDLAPFPEDTISYVH